MLKSKVLGYAAIGTSVALALAAGLEAINPKYAAYFSIGATALAAFSRSLSSEVERSGVMLGD